MGPRCGPFPFYSHPLIHFPPFAAWPGWAWTHEIWISFWSLLFTTCWPVLACSFCIHICIRKLACQGAPGPRSNDAVLYAQNWPGLRPPGHVASH